jgi:hypothetical protein
LSHVIALSTEFQIEPGGKMHDCHFEAGLAGPAVAVIDAEALKSAFIDCCMSRGWISVDRETNSCCLTAQGKTELSRLGLRNLKLS